ncbi:hypothetical protein Y032_0002g1136 [Ancylostoma ceylanicum]|uniref:Uncharacterized protein n=1 Tax=Ancylostoma ceylanicum TaxID=53326 RepID=A0A016W0R0_9BILA|nr:hypothetical protein Y032_0002g1136 [Ancylostoma ceylanicum]
MTTCSQPSVSLNRFALMRLRLQEGGALTTEDVREVKDAVRNCDFASDDTLRHSLTLLMEATCRRMWQESEFAQSSIREGHCDFASMVIQKIGGSVEKMLFLGELCLVVVKI